jgi:hypothetical protein
MFSEKAYQSPNRGSIKNTVAYFLAEEAEFAENSENTMKER